MVNKPYVLYYDNNKLRVVGDKIDLGISEAGQVNNKEVFLENKIKFPFTYLFQVLSGNLVIVKAEGKLSPGTITRIPLKTEPSIKEMKPIEGKIKIKINYVIS